MQLIGILRPGASIYKRSRRIIQEIVIEGTIKRKSISHKNTG
jgi:hypothetical protein